MICHAKYKNQKTFSHIYWHVGHSPPPYKTADRPFDLQISSWRERCRHMAWGMFPAQKKENLVQNCQNPFYWPSVEFLKAGGGNPCREEGVIGRVRSRGECYSMFDFSFQTQILRILNSTRLRLCFIAPQQSKLIETIFVPPWFFCQKMGFYERRFWWQVKINEKLDSFSDQTIIWNFNFWDYFILFY